MKELVSNGVGRCTVTIESRNKTGSCLQTSVVGSGERGALSVGLVIVWGMVGRLRHTEEEDGCHAMRDIFFGFVLSWGLDDKE